jgi:catechol 2,3-dioxygenase
MTDSEPRPIRDLAHLGHVELLSPRPVESLEFFHTVFGMEVEAREGQSAFLRGWGDYQRYCLKLTEARQAGLGHLAFRAWGPEELDRRVAEIERTGFGIGWIDGDLGHGPAYRFTDPDGHIMEVHYETEHYVAPEGLRPVHRNQPQRYVGRGVGVKRLDHVNLMAGDVEASRRFAQDPLGFRLYERNVLDDGLEVGAWMSLTIAAHELIYVADNAGGRGRLHHAAFWVDSREDVLRAADIFLDSGVPIEVAPSKHAAAQAFFLYGFEPGGNRIEVTSGGYFVYAPDAPVMVRTQSEMARGMAWGAQLPRSFHVHGTPPIDDAETSPSDEGEGTSSVAESQHKSQPKSV